MVPVVEQFPLIVVNHCVDYSAQRPTEYTKETLIVFSDVENAFRPLAKFYTWITDNVPVL